LADAPPNAKRVGFTGTPIYFGGADTAEVFLAESDAFDSDRSRERFWLTNCPQAWLKRVC
jgi:hypothetical protein